MESSEDTEEPPLPLALSSFQVSEEFGFLLPDPLTELPAPYGPWMELAQQLPQLICSHQLRSQVHQMPQLSTQHLQGREELHLAHLVLSFITMGYVWQEGEEGTVQVLPRNLAVPYWEVSQALGLPPILSHADFVLANWRRKDPNGPLEIENLDTIIALPGGESLRGFILVTLLVEKAAVPGIKAIVRALSAMLQRDEQSLHRALEELAGAIEAMSEALRRMHDYVDPEIFYSVIRIFLSGPSLTAMSPAQLEGQSCHAPRAHLRGGVPGAPGLLRGQCGAEHGPARLRRAAGHLPPPGHGCLPAQDEGLHAAAAPRVPAGAAGRGLPGAAGRGLGGRAAPRRLQPLRGRAHRLQVPAHRHRHQVHRHRGGQSPGQAGTARGQRWPRCGEAPGCAGGQRDRRVPHLQLPQEHQGHHQGGDDKCLTAPRVPKAAAGGRGAWVSVQGTSQDPKPAVSSSSLPPVHAWDTRNCWRRARTQPHAASSASSRGTGTVSSRGTAGSASPPGPGRTVSLLPLLYPVLSRSTRSFPGRGAQLGRTRAGGVSGPIKQRFLTQPGPGPVSISTSQRFSSSRGRQKPRWAPEQPLPEPGAGMGTGHGERLGMKGRGVQGTAKGEKELPAVTPSLWHPDTAPREKGTVLWVQGCPRGCCARDEAAPRHRSCSPWPAPSPSWLIKGSGRHRGKAAALGGSHGPHFEPQ
ncbi:indoleamine 2,3-dioxygenase 2 isoform X2 [Oenanthe melanoleuca]|uniref:indoleamine 2,3-dioxygenase 2 isoform X2 n=1 Tax=Oenanthe melanoleuca TaxID=2939378 RepID=UPI0024C1F824|nr:indoleamine 2,3-dioxygenase 2 isoform X2 [Oenanthe melanoleuca]